MPVSRPAGVQPNTPIRAPYRRQQGSPAALSATASKHVALATASVHVSLWASHLKRSGLRPILSSKPKKIHPFRILQPLALPDAQRLSHAPRHVLDRSRLHGPLADLRHVVMRASQLRCCAPTHGVHADPPCSHPVLRAAGCWLQQATSATSAAAGDLLHTSRKVLECRPLLAPAVSSRPLASVA